MENFPKTEENSSEKNLKVNSEGKKYEYEKDGVYYGGDYLAEPPQELNINA